MTPKTENLWKIGKELEEKFIKGLGRINILCTGLGTDTDVRELFKMIRSAEYRRGKEEALNGKG